MGYQYGISHAIIPYMDTAKITLDRAGRVSIPSGIRRQMQLAPGDTFTIEHEGEQITLRPARAALPLRKEHGVWVYRSGRATDVSLRDLVEEQRDQRHRSLSGRNS